ncbi:hypothetical protein AYI68_g6513 [Smittium mucronatum]|uniref:Uncharacterized protein n=1 Tax=Smittium mucronatum TaxID=133383 RepID=A0A1R0GR96_9FUNG|nr:hypothetical protein AYI68_g6513 [Smittium mucronatum]
MRGNTPPPAGDHLFPSVGGNSIFFLFLLVAASAPVIESAGPPHGYSFSLSSFSLVGPRFCHAALPLRFSLVLRSRLFLVSPAFRRYPLWISCALLAWAGVTSPVEQDFAPSLYRRAGTLLLPYGAEVFCFPSGCSDRHFEAEGPMFFPSTILLLEAEEFRFFPSLIFAPLQGRRSLMTFPLPILFLFQG